MQYESTSLTLLQRLRDHQQEAWERLIELYGPLVQYWCRRSDLSREDTADIFQETFRAVSSHFDQFNKNEEGGSFRGWLRTVTANKIRDHYRRSQKEAQAPGGTDAQLEALSWPDPVDAWEEEEETSLIQQSVRRSLDWIKDDFEEKTWRAFWELQMKGRDSADIAAELNMTPAAVRKSKYRVLRRLKEELHGLDF